MRNSRPYMSPNAALCWSMLLPGFGQLYNKDYFLGITLLALEIIINLHAHLNLVLFDSFNGDVFASHHSINYSWGLFYPALYGYAMWQAYNAAKANNRKLIGEPVATRTYLSGFFIGIVLGMDLGLFLHDQPWFKKIAFLDYPVFNGLLFGLALGFLGHFLEKNVYRKHKKTIELDRTVEKN
ncbi:hypothetical protein [Neobacillus jeddahensis]|uniref:hypothetical protein n=1 Tax=Neobacillus jeddahensis TaxID=1461580 RepID=UPI0005AA4FFC|nr:hypothetical protein [Neobacillus jeddahensis]